MHAIDSAIYHLLSGKANVPSATRNGTVLVVKGIPIADFSIRKNLFLRGISCLFKRQWKSKEQLLLVRYFDHDDKGKETRLLDDSVLDFVLIKFYVVLESGLINKKHHLELQGNFGIILDQR